MHRFSRTELLIGADGLDRLARARVAVIGLGAVGSYAVEGLARAGVGHLRLVDFDVVRLTNVNRQLYALETTLGRAKADVARERVAAINPACEVECRHQFFHTDTAGDILHPPLDLVIDAIDSVRPKIELIAAALRARLPILSVMGAALRTDPSMIRVGDIEATERCPLARFVRKGLRRRGASGPVRCIYSLEPLPADATPPMATDVAGQEQDAMLGRGRPRKALGSLSTLTGIFGLWAATEAILLLCGRNSGWTLPEPPAITTG